MSAIHAEDGLNPFYSSELWKNGYDVFFPVAADAMFTDPAKEKSSLQLRTTAVFLATITLVALSIFTILLATGTIPFANSLSANAGAIAGLSIGTILCAIGAIYTGHHAIKSIRQIHYHTLAANLIYDRSFESNGETHFYYNHISQCFGKWNSTRNIGNMLSSEQVNTLLDALDAQIAPIAKIPLIHQEQRRAFVNKTWENQEKLQTSCTAALDNASNFIRNIYACNFKYFTSLGLT